MKLDRQTGGHAFSFDAGVCAKCGMFREHYEDNGKPRCAGVKPPQRANELGFVLPRAENE